MFVSAGELAGGRPDRHYASGTARPDDCPLSHLVIQSDEVRRTAAWLKFANRRLRAACVWSPKTHQMSTYYRGLAALWKTQKIATVDQAMFGSLTVSNRMFFSRQRSSLWRGKRPLDREYFAFQLREFHNPQLMPFRAP